MRVTPPYVPVGAGISVDSCCASCHVAASTGCSFAVALATSREITLDAQLGQLASPRVARAAPSPSAASGLRAAPPAPTLQPLPATRTACEERRDNVAPTASCL